MLTLSPPRLIALCLANTLSILTLTLLPYEVSALMDGYGLSTDWAGFVVSAELLILASTTAWLSRTIDNRNKRTLTVVGVMVGIASCVGSALVADPSALIVLRLFFGIASGMIAAATNAIPPLGREPERVFAYMQVAIGIVFGLAVYIAGVVQGIFGRSSVFVVELAFFVVFGAGALLLPEARVAGSSTSTIESRKLSAPVWAGISSVALMWIALAGAWAFAQQAGAAVQLSIESTAGWMSIGGFLTPLGAVAAALIGERYGYSRPLLIGFLFQIAVMIALYCLGNPAAYLTSLILLNFPITFIGAYLMGLIGSLEVTGRGTSLAGAAVNFGGAAGPALGAVFLSGRALSRVGWFAAITLALGLALSCVAARHWQKTHR